MIQELSLEYIEKSNRLFNESTNPWTNWDLLELTYTSYFYYDDEIEQMSSVFRNLNCNHCFSNGNKRTAANILMYYLAKINKYLDDDFLFDLCYETMEKHYFVEEIAKKIKANLKTFDD